MFDVPVESTYVWFGLALVGVATLGLALEVPAAPPPEAAELARTVDRVAASPYEATASHPLAASRLRLGPERVGLDGPGGPAHAAFAYDSVVPATASDDLTAVLRGEPPSRVFETRGAFRRAIEAARAADPRWQPAPDRVLVRRVSWGDVNGTLVGA
jgi:hypothetical protein